MGCCGFEQSGLRGCLIHKACRIVFCAYFSLTFCVWSVTALLNHRMYFPAYFCNGCIKSIHFRNSLPLIENLSDTKWQSLSLKFSQSKSYKCSNNNSSSMQQIKLRFDLLLNTLLKSSLWKLYSVIISQQQGMQSLIETIKVTSNSFSCLLRISVCINIFLDEQL